MAHGIFEDLIRKGHIFTFKDSKKRSLPLSREEGIDFDSDSDSFYFIFEEK
jgi:hypothetical protein